MAEIIQHAQVMVREAVTHLVLVGCIKIPNTGLPSAAAGSSIGIWLCNHTLQQTVILHPRSMTMLGLSLLPLLPIFASVAPVHGSPVAAAAPTASVRNGTYVGFSSPKYSQDIFLGIPYAQPPVGDLPFRPPASLNTTWTGARNATQYSPECYGYGSDDWILGNYLSEDCLTLNVVRPQNAGENLPVGVWIFGGGLTDGGTLDPRYNLSFIVKQSALAGKPFIGVSINYRLQAFGFLGGQEVYDDGALNSGIRDQRLALHWIQENVAAFGGDPSKVVIWGESAGASSIGFHLVAYGGRDDGRFRGAIMESGTVVGKAFNTPDAWQPSYDKIVNATNCSSAANTLNCLRHVPIDILSPIFNSSVTSGATFSAQQDGDMYLAKSGTGMVQNGSFVKVPILHGRNHDEGTSFATKGINTTEQFMQVITAAGADNATAKTFAALYPDIPEIGIPGTLHGRPPPSLIGSLGSMWKRAAAYAGDMNHHAPRRVMSRSWAKQNITSYSYVFNVFPAGVDATIGVTHFAEVAWVFHNIDGYGYNNSLSKDPFAGVDQNTIDVATLMSRMWASFISDLTPNNNACK